MLNFISMLVRHKLLNVKMSTFSTVDLEFCLKVPCAGLKPVRLSSRALFSPSLLFLSQKRLGQVRQIGQVLLLQNIFLTRAHAFAKILCIHIHSSFLIHGTLGCAVSSIKYSTQQLLLSPLFFRGGNVFFQLYQKHSFSSAILENCV